MKTYSFFVIAMIFSWSILGQLPSTDLYLLEFTKNEDKIIPRKVSFLNGFNIGGYNNQPTFSAFNKIYLSTNRYDEDQTDIIELDLSNETILRITDTEVSEYSPTPHPSGNQISTVRVEADGTTQSLWIYPKDRSDYGYRILKGVGDIGYHHWLSEEELILFRLPSPFTLSIVNIKTKSSKIIVDNIGRCIKSDENGSFLFIHKETETDWFIKRYDVETGELNTVCKTLSGSEDFERLRDESFVMGNGSKLFYFNEKTSAEWSEMIDMSRYGIDKISRIAVNNNKMIIVNNK